jgi:hypothetical protein
MLWQIIPTLILIVLIIGLILFFQKKELKHLTDENNELKKEIQQIKYERDIELEYIRQRYNTSEDVDSSDDEESIIPQTPELEKELAQDLIN